MDLSAVRYVLSSVLSVAADNVIYYFLFTPLGTVWAQIIARVLSSQFNFNMNNFFVFKNKENYWGSMGKYYCLCVPQALISVFAVKKLTDMLSVTKPMLATAIKLCVDFILFVISYIIQHKWVFNSEKKESGE